MKRTISVILALGAVLAASTALADTSGKKIALSNNYAGNSWRQSMLKSWDKVTKQAVADGVVAAADPFTTSENQVTEQAAQIQNLVLQVLGRGASHGLASLVLLGLARSYLLSPLPGSSGAAALTTSSANLRWLARSCSAKS